MGSAHDTLKRLFYVGDRRIDPLRLLVTNAVGRDRILAQRAMSVLVALARANGEVVKKYDWGEAVWNSG